MATDTPTPNISPDKGQPEKYIRTFAGDMQTLKAGGVPDLAPLIKSTEAPRERPANPPKPVPPPPPKPVSPPPPPAPVIPPPTLVPPPEPAPIELPKPVAPPIPEPKPIERPAPPPTFVRTPPPIEPAEPLPPPTPLQTYASDFTDKIKETHSTTATILAAQQDSATGNPELEPKEKSSHTLLYSILGTVLLIGGGVGAYFAFASYTVENQPVVVAPVIKAPIFVDDREKISGTGLGLFQAIGISVNKTITTGTVRLLYIETSTTSPDSVFSALRMSAPDVLLRNIHPEGSMAGVANINGTQSPFFILSVDSYSETFAGMLQWEPKILNDMKDLFPPYPTPVPTATIIATTTVATTTPTTKPKKGSKTATTTPVIVATPVPTIVQPTFTDEVIANHDVRIFRDIYGNVVMMYGYWNQSTLVIARDRGAFGEIMQRLANSKAQ